MTIGVRSSIVVPHFMMSSIRVFWIFAFALVLGSSPVLAQQSNDGSLYSRYGLGTMQSPFSSQAEAMGEAGTALISPNYLSLSNPASWSSQILTRFIGSFKYHSVQAKDAANNTSRVNAGSIRGAAFSFPILTRKLGFVAAYEPLTRMGYQVETTDSISGAGAGDASQYRSVLEGNGGLQVLRGGLGYRINRYIRVGASADLVFGILENSRQTLFQSNKFVDTHTTQSTRLRGATATVGGLALIPNLLTEEDGLSLGLSARLPTTLTGTRVSTVGETLSRDTVGTALKGTASLPLRLQAGLAYQASSYVTISLEGLYAPWEQFESSLNFNGSQNGFNNRWKVGGGLEYRPAGRNPSASYLSRVNYRLGAYAEQSYAKPHPTVDLRNYAVTSGISLPTGVGGNRVDLNLEVGTRGTTSHNLVRDTYYTASLVLNFGERWFRKRLIQ